MGNPFITAYCLICVHFLGLGRVKNLPGPVADENTALHPALTAIVIAVLVLGLPAVIFGALWKKYGKDYIYTTAHEAYCLTVVIFQ